MESVIERKAESVINRTAWVLIRVAAFFLAAMMLISVGDIVLRWLFDLPVFGTFDLVELFLVAMVFLAIPESFLREEHVVVEIIDQFTRPRTQAVLRAVSTGLALGFLALIEIQMIQPAYDMYDFGDETKDLEIPKIVHWIPILLGMLCATIAVGLLFVRDLARAISGGERG